VTAAEVVADGLRRAGVARVFAADGADPTLTEAILAARLPIVPGARAASAITMASITGQLGDAPGVAIIRDDVPGVSASLAEGARARAPIIVLASRAPAVSAAVIKTTVVASPDSAAHWAAHAAQAAMAEQPGPVWLVVAPEVASRSALPLVTAARPPVVPLDVQAIDAVARHLAAATRPLIVAGRECRAPATAGWLRALAEALPAPVLVTPAARGALPDPHPLCLGPLSADAAILRRADLVLALGVDADELAVGAVTFTTPVVRLGRTATWDAPRGIPVAEAGGDVAMLLEELASRLRDRARADWDVAEVDRLRRARPSPAVDAPLTALVAQLRKATPAGTVAVFARAIEPATALWLTVNPEELIVANAMVPTAIGTALQRPDGAVLGLVSGASEMRFAELPVAVDARARVIVVTLDADARDVGAARALGVRVAVAASPSALALALGAGLETAGPSVIAVRTAG
jgi:thiamine pyrophosphate-dependent acetolactate synthase large subunit-like protein